MRKQAPKTETRPIVARAFGTYIKGLRVHQGWSQENVAQLLQDRIAISGTFISHLEQGKVAAPDPVLLRELALLYGKNVDDLVELLRLSRRQPTAVIEELRSALPGEADMVVRGLEEHFIRKFRQLRERDRATILEQIDFIQSRGAADAGAIFRGEQKHKPK